MEYMTQPLPISQLADTQSLNKVMVDVCCGLPPGRVPVCHISVPHLHPHKWNRHRAAMSSHCNLPGCDLCQEPERINAGVSDLSSVEGPRIMGLLEGRVSGLVPAWTQLLLELLS